MKTSVPKEAKEVRAGALVTVSMIILLFLLFSAGKIEFLQNTYKVPILFSYISGLEKNAPVQFAGHKVGKVADIRFVREKDATVQVTVSVSKDVVLKKDSAAHIDVMGFMGEKMVELTAGTPEASPLSKGEFIRGTDPVAMMEVVKQGTELLQEFETINDSLKNLVGDLEQVVGENRGDFNQIVDNLNETSVNLKEMTADLKHHPWKLLRKSDEKKKHFLFF